MNNMFAVTLVILMVTFFLFGYFSSDNFSRYSSENNWKGFKNYIKMKRGLWKIYRGLTKEEKKAIEEKLKEPEENVFGMEKNIFEKLKNEPNPKKNRDMIFAYYQAKNINTTGLKESDFITTFDNSPLLKLTRDVEKIWVSSKEDVIENHDKLLLREINSEKENINIIDYLNIYLTKIRWDEGKKAEEHLLGPALLRFGDEKQKNTTRNIKINKKRINEILQTIDDLNKEYKELS